MRKIFLEKLYAKCGVEASPRPFIKIEMENISGSTIGNVVNFFSLYVQVEVYQTILLKLTC